MPNNNKQVLIIKGTLPGLNEYTRACRSFRISGASMKKDAEETVGWSIVAKKLHPVHAPVFLVFYWYEPNWMRDADNIAFAKKYIFDALVAQRILKNDSRKNFVLGFFDFFPEPIKTNPHITVEIWEMPGIVDMRSRVEVMELFIDKMRGIPENI